MDVRFAPKSGPIADGSVGLLCANSRHFDQRAIRAATAAERAIVVVPGPHHQSAAVTQLV
jgi:hypothetical protein